MPASQIISPTDPGANGATAFDNASSGVQALLNLPKISTSTGIPTSTAPVAYGALKSASANVGAGSSTILSGPRGTSIIPSAGVFGSASATVTATSLLASAGLNANASLSLVTASGVTVSLQENAGAQASASASFNSDGLHLSAAVGASATDTDSASYSSDLGSAGSITAGSSVTEGVVAVAAGSTSLGPSGVSASASSFAGPVTAVTVGSTYTGEGVSAGAGAGVYAPGSVGASSSFGALNQDGYVGISAGVVLDTPLGGLALNIQFGAKTQDIVNIADSFANAFKESYEPPPKIDFTSVDDQHVEQYFNAAYQDGLAVFNKAAGAVTSAVNTIGNDVTSVVNTVEKGVDQAINTVGSTFTTVEQAIVSGANTTLSFLKNTFGHL